MSNSYSEIFRPKKPEQLIGDSQVAAATSLLKRVEDNNLLQEILFSGPSGIGKTTIAKMYIQNILGIEYDKLDNNITEMDCGSDTGIDHIRIIKDAMQYLPMSLKYRIFYLDEIHGLSRQAQNALLKTIEPVPKHVIFIASTTEPQKLIPTLKSRLTEYELHIPTTNEFKKLAHWISLSLNGTKKIELDAETLDEIISLSSGNIRAFERNLQKFYDGSFLGWKPLEEDENSLLNCIMFGRKPINQWFRAAANEVNIKGSIIGLCNYSAKVIKNPRSNADTLKRAMKVIKYFGDGQVFEIMQVYQKLILLYEELN